MLVDRDGKLLVIGDGNDKIRQVRNVGLQVRAGWGESGSATKALNGEV